MFRIEGTEPRMRRKRLVVTLIALITVICFTDPVVTASLPLILKPNVRLESEGDGSTLVMNVTHSPQYPQPNQRVIITAKISGNSSSIRKVLLVYRERLNYNWYGIHQYWGIYEWSWEPLTWNVYTDWLKVEMKHVGNNTYQAELLELPYYSKVWYKVHVIDNTGKTVVSETKTYSVVRGAEYIIYMEVSTVIYRVMYVAVGLVLVRGLGRSAATSDEGGGEEEVEGGG